MKASGQRVVIESPLNAPDAAGVQRNLRFLLWCCRAVKLRSGHDAIGSHMLNPWFMDDSVPEERAAGIANAWAWAPKVPHWFFLDLGMSNGMKLAEERCLAANLLPSQAFPWKHVWLKEYDPDSWNAFERGEWPPHTKGFKVAQPRPALDSCPRCYSCEHCGQCLCDRPEG